MKIATLDHLLERQLQDIYDAEKQLVKALPKLAKAASSEELREAISEHLEVTRAQVQRIEEVFGTLGVKARSKACAAMKGLIEEGRESMQEDAAEELTDLAMIAAAQRVEHYEIAAYGTASALARALGKEDAAELLDQTLEEEREADGKLTEVSQSILETAVANQESVLTGEDEENAAPRAGTARPRARKTGA